MTREEAKEYIKNQLENYLNSITQKKGQQYICPLCNSGAKANGTPAGSITPDKKYFHCFSCGFNGDTLDLLGAYEGIADDKDKFNRAFDVFNITVKNAHTSHERTQTHKSTTTAQTPLKTQNKDYTAYIMECKANVNKTDYLKQRGFTVETINHYNLGYDENYTQISKKTKKMVNYGKAIIIPYSKNNNYFITRLLDCPDWFKNNYIKPASDEAGAEPIYNLQAIYNKDNDPIFVVEAPFCAISIMQAGAQAIAVGGTGHAKLINQLKAKPTSNTLILSFDNDSAGQEATAKLEQALKPLNIKSFKANISGDCKDPNEALTDDKDIFLKAIQKALAQASNLEDEKKAETEAEREKYINETSVTAHINDFLGQIKKSADTPAIPTNFIELDKVLDDGLYEGLYILGAISSLGKTSFILQIADQIAQQGQDVLIFSLEMAKTELMAKSISRITFLECNGNTANAKTTRGITSGKRHAYYSTEEKKLINDSIMKYSSYTHHLYIYEGIGNIGVEQIRQTTEKHIKATGNKPLIVIDYLQIIAPYDTRATDKQSTDKSVFELKRLSRDFKIPIIGISSLNRESYNTTISMAAFKESGAIEYSSDVLIGLQFEAMGEASDGGAKINAESINKLKRKQPRKIELKILKNRNGATGDSITFDYYPMFNYFQETGKKELVGSASEPTRENARRR